MELFREYEPKSISAFTGHRDAKRKMLRLLERDFDRAAFLLSGPSGTGKTCFARVVCHSLMGNGLRAEMDVHQLSGQRCSMDEVRRVEEKIQYAAWNPSGWRAWIVDECHSMSPKAVQAWLTLLDDLPARRVIFFTTTEDVTGLFGEFASPFASRCYCLSFSDDEEWRAAAAEHLELVARKSGLDGHAGPQTYRELLDGCNGNLRRALQELEMGALQ